MFRYLKSYADVSQIKWADVINKLDTDVRLGQWGYGGPDKDGALPTFIAEGNYIPDKWVELTDKVYDEYGMNAMHSYISFTESSSTLGRHADGMNVLIVQAIGLTSYMFDDGSFITLRPGDAVYIPKGIYHNPHPHGPRLSLSFSEVNDDGDV